MAWTARWWDRAAQASACSRVMPHSRAVFSPMVTDMSADGIPGASGWFSGTHRTGSPPPGGTLVSRGMVLALSVPPATMTSSMPARMVAAASAAAVLPDAQCRLTARPGTPGRPRRTAILRPITPPPWRDSPRMRSPSSLTGTPDRVIAALTAISASSNASTAASEPRRARPTGVRAAARMTASGTSASREGGGQVGARSRRLIPLPGDQAGEDLATQDLPRRRLGQLAPEYDQGRGLRAAQPGPDPVAQFLRAGGPAGAEHDRGG